MRSLALALLSICLVSRAHADDCADVCAHRAECGLTTASCASECSSVAPAYPSWALQSYVHESCADLKKDEPNFRNAVLAAKACDHRASCVGDGDRDACVADITMAAYRDDVLVDYARWSCDRVVAAEPTHHEIRQVVATCKHLLECEVPGDMRRCLLTAKDFYFDRHAYELSQLEAWASESCETLRATVFIIPPEQARTQGRSGWSSASGGQRWAPGWFGSWTDTRGNKVYHRPPGPGVF